MSGKGTARLAAPGRRKEAGAVWRRAHWLATLRCRARWRSRPGLPSCRRAHTRGREGGKRVRGSWRGCARGLGLRRVRVHAWSLCEKRTRWAGRLSGDHFTDATRLGAGPLPFSPERSASSQVAKTKQQIEEQRVQVQVVERAQQVAVQEQEIARREKELEARVQKPAEAERYRLERLAEAEKSQLIMQAEAEAESVRMRGEAEAFAIGARARAEAEQMAKKAEAFQLYQEAAQLDMLLEKLPQVAEEISGPLTSTKKITLVSSGSGAVGAAKVTGEVLDILSHLPESVERLTGISISQVNHKPLRTA